MQAILSDFHYQLTYVKQEFKSKKNIKRLTIFQKINPYQFSICVWAKTLPGFDPIPLLKSNRR